MLMIKDQGFIESNMYVMLYRERKRKREKRRI